VGGRGEGRRREGGRGKGRGEEERGEELIRVTNIIQGLYPESHGIVNNNFYDTELKEKFFVRSPNATDSKWWEGEPVSYRSILTHPSH
jgi:hypothetical protein